MSEMSKAMEQRLKKARIQMLLDQPFFGTLATRLENRVGNEVTKTACTDGKVILWNEKYVDGLSDAQLKFIIAHEVMHVANGHAWRRGGRNQSDWNLACDKAINPLLKEAGFELLKEAKMPDGGSATQCSAEALYVESPPGDKNKGKGGGAGGSNGDGSGGSGQQPDPGGCGGVMDSPAGEEQKTQEAEWKIAVSQAATAAKSQGKLPAGLERLVEDLVNPKVPWSVLLRDFVERTAKNDYSWSRPNPRYAALGFVLPTLISEELPEIVVAIDTSGSIGKTELDAFAAEISGVLGAYETTIKVIYADAKVQEVETVTRAELPLVLKPKGGGGTDFRPVFKWIEKQGMTPACTIYLTDGYGDFPKKEPDHPVLWVMTSEVKAPWGDNVELDLGC